MATFEADTNWGPSVVLQASARTLSPAVKQKKNSFTRKQGLSFLLATELFLKNANIN